MKRTVPIVLHISMGTALSAAEPLPLPSRQMNTQAKAIHCLDLLAACALLASPLSAQDAAPADRNAVNTRAKPGDMMADSPVKFPAQGALPSKFPPDRSARTNEALERDYFIFRTPERSLEQIQRIQADMPAGTFAPPPNDWERLQRTHRILTEGGELRLLALGDSIVNDTMRSGWVARLQQAYPKARITATVYVRGGGGCQHFRQEERVAKNIAPRRPDLIFIGGISQKSIADIREVIRQCRAALPEVEILLAAGTFGTTDPRDQAALANAPHSGTGAYGAALQQLANEEKCAYLDMTTPWAEYIRSSKLHPHVFYRDVVHANEFGEQILAKILMAFWAPPSQTAAAPTTAAVPAADPDFGPSVLLFDPAQPGIQERIEAVFREQERAQFGRGRYALLFKPGRYSLHVPVGFFTHVAGLGKLPGDATILGPVWTDAAWMKRNATCNFWRSVENLTVAPTNRVNVWAVSQAAPLRRAHIRADLHLSSGGWSSGGFMADCRIDGVVKAGSQQQWFSRNSAWQEWQGVNWNMVFVGCENPPAGQWPERAVTRIPKAPSVREKPFLFLEHGRWFVKAPPLRPGGASGLTWERGDAPGDALPLEAFYLAKAGRDTAATLNAALRDGKHLLITPGIYALEATVVVSRPNTVVFGLGFPSLVPATGKPVLCVEAGEGVVVSGLVCDASATETETLVQLGLPGRKAGRAENPIVVHDLVCRVGGYGPGKAKLMVAIHDDHVIGDNFWLWRADHGANVGWTQNTCATGLRVDGNDVILYGLFVEHTQKHQTIWNGERGRVYFYQSEMPYDPPSQEAWRSTTGDGFASYKIGEHVQAHEAWGLGVYHVFKRAAVVAESAIEAPAGPGIRIHHALTFRLGGGRPGSGIRHVLNNQGGETIQAQKAMVR